MIFGSHDTMTYRTPKEWYLRPVKFLAQCQDKDYKQQHEYGADSMDLRLFWDKDNNIEFRHGMFSYDASDFDEVLKYCEDNNIVLRILFEDRYFPKSLRKRSEKQNLGQKFTDTCKYIEEKYPNLKCYGGRSTEGDKSYYTFKYEGKYQDYGYYSSVTSMFNCKNKILMMIDDWCPRIYAWFMNKKNKEKYGKYYNDQENVILHFDFIEVG